MPAHKPEQRPDDICVDVSHWPQLGPYKVLPAGVSIYQDGRDYREGIYPIWSIGRCDRDFSFEFAGVTFLAPAGTTLLSRGGDLYQADGIECLWLR